MLRSSVLGFLVFLIGVVLPVNGWGYGFSGYPGGGDNLPYSQPGAGGDQQRSLRVQRGRNENGYYLRIYLQGYRPGDVKVGTRRNRLVLQVTAGDQRGAGDMRSQRVSRWWTGYRRQFRLPFDADPAGMTRTEKDGVVEILIPARRQPLPHR